jgi:3-oxoacyl-[acyl-carrier protein] reductase
MMQAMTSSSRQHVALVTGANHGIGAAVARVLAARGVAVLCTYRRLEDPVDPAIPDAYRRSRAMDAGHVVEAIVRNGGRAVALEADLADPATPARLFDFCEERLGPVDILINNATRFVQDTFAPRSVDAHGRAMSPVTYATWRQQFSVDAQAAALLIAEFARRHAARGGTWGRIVGLASGSDLGFPSEVSYGAAKAAQVSYTMSAAVELASLGVTANVVQPGVTDTGWVTDAVRETVARSERLFTVATPEQGGRGDRVPGVGRGVSRDRQRDPVALMSRAGGAQPRRSAQPRVRRNACGG